MWRSEDNLEEWVLSFHPVGLGDRAVRLFLSLASSGFTAEPLPQSLAVSDQAFGDNSVCILLPHACVPVVQNKTAWAEHIKNNQTFSGTVAPVYDPSI